MALQYVREIDAINRDLQQLNGISEVDDSLIYRLEHLSRRILEHNELEEAAFPIVRAADQLREALSVRPALVTASGRSQTDELHEGDRLRIPPTTALSFTGNPGRPRLDIDKRKLTFFIGRHTSQ